MTRFPLLGPDAVPTWGAMLFTAFALIGMTNAINHSDGLDGLAGGESVLSLVAIGFLAYLGDGDLTVLDSGRSHRRCVRLPTLQHPSRRRVHGR